MCLVQEIFLNNEDKVALRIRIGIDPPRPGDYNPAAILKLVSGRSGKSFHGIGKTIVNGNADVIDFGIEPQNLAHKKPDQHEGNAMVNIIYDPQIDPQMLPEACAIKINSIEVSTEKALKIDENDESEGPKTLRAISK